MSLTLEERGAYNTILDLIYCSDGAIADDEYFVAGWLRVDRRIWRRLRLSLLEKQKIYIHAGQIRNERADRGVLEGLHRVAVAANAGLASAASRKQTIDILKAGANGRSTDVQPTYTYTQKESFLTESHSRKKGNR